MNFFNKIFEGFSLPAMKSITQRRSDSPAPISQQGMIKPIPILKPIPRLKPIQRKRSPSVEIIRESIKKPKVIETPVYAKEKQKQIIAGFKEAVKSAEDSKRTKALPAGKKSIPANAKVFPFKELSTDIASDVLIARSKIPEAGNGAFTKIDLPKGRAIGIYGGKIITEKEAQKSNSKYILHLRMPHSIYVDGAQQGNWTSKINHSDNPNVEIKGNGVLYTLRHIAKGEELTFDYGKDKDWFIKGPANAEDKLIRYITPFAPREKTPYLTYTFKHQAGIDLPSNQITLGEGAYGTVVEGTFQGNKVAVKLEPLTELGVSRWTKEVAIIEKIKNFYDALKLLTSTTAPITNVTANKLKENQQHILVNNQRNKTMGIQVYNLLDGYLTITDWAQKNKTAFVKNWPSIRELILKDLKKWYDNGYVHNDLHLNNVMIHPGTKKIAIIDFGMIKTLDTPKPSWDRVKNQYYEFNNLFSSQPSLTSPPGEDCPICMDENNCYVLHKVNGTAHTIGLNCLKRLVPIGGNRFQKIKCPVCRQMVDVDRREIHEKQKAQAKKVKGKQKKIAAYNKYAAKFN